MSISAAILTTGPEQTQEAGRAIGEQAQPGDIFLLTGPLGAGKTCLTQGVAQGLGVSGYVRSPTFVLTSRYQGRLTLYHLDLYRINSPEEAWDLGLDEQLFGDGICVVEWADRAAQIFPPGSLWTELDHVDAGDRRSISFIDWPDRCRPLLERLSTAFPVPPLPPVSKEIKS